MIRGMEKINGQRHNIRMTTAISIVVMVIVPVTAIPYAAARLVEL